ncbi:hypothetical protein EVG20_g5512, partial [Dentipellis fragilis]
MSEKSEKNFDFSDWSNNMPHPPPAYGRFSPPPGPPPQNPFHQSSGYHSDDPGCSGSRSRGLNDSYYSPPPGDPYSRGSSPYGGPSYGGFVAVPGPSARLLPISLRLFAERPILSRRTAVSWFLVYRQGAAQARPAQPSSRMLYA